MFACTSTAFISAMLPVKFVADAALTKATASKANKPVTSAASFEPATNLTVKVTGFVIPASPKICRTSAAVPSIVVTSRASTTPVVAAFIEIRSAASTAPALIVKSTSAANCTRPPAINVEIDAALPVTVSAPATLRAPVVFATTDEMVSALKVPSVSVTASLPRPLISLAVLAV